MPIDRCIHLYVDQCILSLSQTHLFSLIENKCQREFLSHLAAAAAVTRQERCEQIKMPILCASNVQFSSPSSLSRSHCN